MHMHEEYTFETEKTKKVNKEVQKMIKENNSNTEIFNAAIAELNNEVCRWFSLFN